MVRNSCKNKDDENDSFHENSHTPSFVIDKKGRLLDVNNAFCQKLGCNKDEVLGLKLKDTGLLTEESRKKMMWMHVSRLIGKRKPFFTIDVTTKDGDVLTLEINTKPYIKNGRKVGEIGVVRKTLEFTKPEKEYFRRKELKKTIKELERVRIELDIKLREISEIQVELEKKREEVETLNEDLETRNGIIEEINSQLMEKQTLLVEKTGTIEQLRRELERVQNELEKGNEELNTSRRELEEINEELMAAKREIEDIQEETRSLNENLLIRNNIIDEIKDQLAEKQTLLVEKTSKNRKLQTDLDQKQKELLTRDEKLRTAKLEIENRCDELESLTANLKIRDAIIEKIKEQLTEKQMLLVEKTESVGRLQTDLQQKQEEMEDLNKRFQETCTKLDLADMAEKSADIIASRMELGERGIEKDFMHRQQPQEGLIDESIDVGGRKPIVGELETEREMGEKKLEFVEETEEEQTILTERLKLYEEIDKVLDRADDILKTKKIEDKE